MIYDDHEVRDNWGDLTSDWDSSTPDFFVARCAWLVSMEYQRQLHEDVDFTQVEKIHQVCIGKIGMRLAKLLLVFVIVDRWTLLYCHCYY